jgi:hypothetical protein
MTCQQTPHYCGYWSEACFEEQVAMIGKQCPGITTSVAIIHDRAQSFQEVVAIVVIPKDIAFFDSSGNNMVQSTRGIYASFSRHG